MTSEAPAMLVMRALKSFKWRRDWPLAVGVIAAGLGAGLALVGLAYLV